MLWLKLESLLFIGAEAGADEKNTRSRSKRDRFRNTVHDNHHWHDNHTLHGNNQMHDSHHLHDDHTLDGLRLQDNHHCMTTMTSMTAIAGTTKHVSYITMAINSYILTTIRVVTNTCMVMIISMTKNTGYCTPPILFTFLVLPIRMYLSGYELFYWIWIQMNNLDLDPGSLLSLVSFCCLFILNSG